MLTTSQVDILEKLVGRLKSIHSELGSLAKKSPNDGVNTFKLGLVNEVLTECNKLLGAQYRPLETFLVFDPDAVPSNSDVTFVVAQYMEGIEKFRADNIQNRSGVWFYKISDTEESIRASAPEKLTRK